MKNKIIYLIIGILISGCVQESGKEIANYSQQDRTNIFIGDWLSAEREYPYEAYLIIRKDSTFHFEYGACLASGFSNGRWKIADSILILNSNVIDSCVYIRSFGDDCIVVDLELDSDYIRKESVKNCKPIHETEYIEFKNEKFYFDFDTLRHIVKKAKLCPEIKNDFIRFANDTTT